MKLSKADDAVAVEPAGTRRKPTRLRGPATFPDVAVSVGLLPPGEDVDSHAESVSRRFTRRCSLPTDTADGSTNRFKIVV